MSVSGLNDIFVSSGLTPSFGGMSCQTTAEQVGGSPYGYLVNNVTYNLERAWSGCTLPIVLNNTGSSSACAMVIPSDLTPGESQKYDFYVSAVGTAVIQVIFPALSSSCALVTTGQDPSLSTTSQTTFIFSGTGAHTFQFNATDTGTNAGIRVADRISILVFRPFNTNLTFANVTYHSSYPSGISGASIPFSYT